MSEAYFPVESGALGPEENFLSLDDIVMSQEKLPVRVETPMPRLGAFFLERGAGAEADHPLPQVRREFGWGGRFTLCLAKSLSSGPTSLPYSQLAKSACGVPEGRNKTTLEF